MRAYRGIRNLHSRQCLTLSQRKMIECPGATMRLLPSSATSSITDPFSPPGLISPIFATAPPDACTADSSDSQDSWGAVKRSS